MPNATTVDLGPLVGERTQRRLDAVTAAWLAVAGIAPFVHSCSPGDDPAPTGPGEGAQAPRIEVDVYAFGRQLGTIAPCGCTTEPLGGLAYAMGHIQATSSAGRRLLLEPGSFLFPDPEGPEAPTDPAAWAQAEQRAALLHGRFSAIDGLVGGLGPTDLASSLGEGALRKWTLPRVLANLPAAARDALPGVAPHRTLALDGGLEIGVTAVLDPSLARSVPALAAATDPLAAARQEVAAMRDAGTGLEIVLVHGPRPLAESIARDVEGVDLVVMGGVLEGTDRGRLGSNVQRIGDAFVLEPGDRAQTLTHLTLSFAPDVALARPPGPGQWTVVAPDERKREELARVEARLARIEGDPAADPTFVARLRHERDALGAQLAGEEAVQGPVVAVFEQVKVTCRRAADPTTASALDGYDKWVADENARRFAGVRPPAPARGRPGFVGMAACEECHADAVAQWRGTAHAGAYDTLVGLGKQFDLSCVSCHVTAFRRPGGAEVVENAPLRAVQCEQCHGAGSRHVDDPAEHPLPATTAASVCLECHTPEHSDTFAYEPYLRDVLGAGHGAAARERLGAGPTGRELRAAGLEKAGGACKKM
jgi:hypothetical protein